MSNGTSNKIIYLPQMRLPYLMNIWMADDFVKTLKSSSRQNIEIT